MTEVDGTAELAERIAARGREALVERLRKAYSDAASAHSDIVTLDDARIEAMVQSAADRADGLQWRRALANVASEELGVSLAEALTLPAVAQAQEIVGAPSYEASLAELVARPVPPVSSAASVPAAAVAPVEEPEAAVPEPVVAAPEPVVGAPPEPESVVAAPSEPEFAVVEPEPEPEPERLEPVQADEMYVELLPEPAPIETEPELAPEPEFAPEPEPSQPELMIDEAEAHGATGELDVVEADDAIFELMPPPEPIEYETESYTIPDAVEDEAPPILEQVPYEPDFDDTSVAAAAAMPEFSGEASPTDNAGEPTQVHSLLDDAPEFTGPLAEGVPASDATAAEESYDQPDANGHTDEYGSEHTVYPPPEDQEVQVTAYHLGGVANLPAGRHSLELRLSESGLDILQPDGDIIGRLHWEEIDTLEVSAVRGRLRRSTRSQSRILVRTKHGDASFEIPGVTSEDLESRVDPLVSRYSVSS